MKNKCTHYYQVAMIAVDDTSHGSSIWDLNKAQDLASQIGVQIVEYITNGEDGLYLAHLPAPMAKALEIAGYLEIRVGAKACGPWKLTAEMP